MGASVILYFGDSYASEYGSDLSYVSLLMFTQEDLKIEAEREDEGEDWDTQTYKFVTTVAEAKRRLDSRGINLYLCRQLFEQFRADVLTQYKHTKGSPKVVKEHVKNPFDFDLYLKTLERVFAQEPNKGIPRPFVYIDEEDDDPEARLISGGNVFTEESSDFFGDILSWVYIRSSLEVLPPETIVTLDLTELIDQGYLEEKELFSIVDFNMRLLLGRIELDYKMYGFVLEDDPSVDNRLREKIIRLNEDQFINHVVFPLLGKMGYERVRKVHFHGPSEFGADILPFRYVTPLGTFEYYSVQAKAVPIHGTSARPGNAAELISQATQAFSVTFVDDIDNERKRVDKFIITTNKAISADARRFIEDATEGRRRLVFLDIDKIVDLVKKHRLLQYVLFNELK